MHEAIIIGAGPAGSACAIELTRQGRRVALVERSAYPRRKVCGEFLSATTIPALDRLGVADRWRSLAGPQIRRLALFAGERVVHADMPASAGYGRGLGRDVLDAILLDEARRRGVDIYQPSRARSIHRNGDLQVIQTDTGDRLEAPLVIAAHGSWEPGDLPSQLTKQRDANDLLGFKAHFCDGALSADVMPLLAFPGGYGGMVQVDGGRLSISCCLRRHNLDEIRLKGESAGDAVERHLLVSCRGVRDVLYSAQRLGPWLAAGPIRPGIRLCFSDDIFRVGNLAGEAHPIIAEGISMAIQSGMLLSAALEGVDGFDRAGRHQAGHRYHLAWKRQFALRVHAANAFAGLAVRPAAHRVLGALFAAMPSLLTTSARLSGKTTPMPTASRRAGN